ncbi:unnamed protein product [Linum tenue]|uniref:GDSL esterase/lipase n=1 Tax=Linum tenue TaxID=586396 RepID=A0AAV0GRL0_9ROSI|nr:unnamed protein product [Linum tenue]
MDPNGSINPIGGFPRRRGPAVVVVLFLLPTLAAGAACFTSIFSFGDSIADTGNQCILLPADPPCTLPFGRTFFHRSTGRNGDGRLMIDFIAEYLGLPLVPPSLGGGNRSDFRTGANFAVGGATALDCELLKNRGIPCYLDNISLGVQLEIGGNDYNFAFSSGISLNKIQELVPMVINTIGLALKEVIKFGATNILVPGNFPVGCVPRILSRFRSSNPRDYDPSTGCLAQYNQFAQLHNEQLQMELNDTRRLYPHVNIIYVDYYNALMPVYLSPKKFGFTGGVLEPCCRFTGGVLKPCCNGGMNRSTICCDEPSTYVNWDGIHFTEATYRLIVKGIMKDGSLTNPNLNASSCLVGDP